MTSDIRLLKQYTLANLWDLTSVTCNNVIIDFSSFIPQEPLSFTFGANEKDYIYIATWLMDRPNDSKVFINFIITVFIEK